MNPADADTQPVNMDIKLPEMPVKKQQFGAEERRQAEQDSTACT